MTDQQPQPQPQPLHAVDPPQSDELDQLETQIRDRVNALDKQIEEAKAQKKAIAVRIGELELMREKAKRMLPRAPRARKARTPATPTPATPPS